MSKTKDLHMAIRQQQVWDEFHKEQRSVPVNKASEPFLINSNNKPKKNK